VLWDVDGTLVDAGGIGAEVFDHALERVLGARPPARVRMSGKTDPQIVDEYLSMMAVAAPEEHVAPVLAELVVALAAAEGAIRARGRALPGVERVLADLDASGTALQTVLTGNVAPNAAVKLGAFGLQRWLDLEIGAYGSDHADRARLVPVALERAARLRGVRFAPADAWVVGDSPADLACARAGGTRCLLVATGRAGYHELAALRPDAVRRDLLDAGEVAALLRS
jgi:phosphoglycolate phosphatase